MLDWLIVGGGIHGTHLAAQIVGNRHVSEKAAAILDPAPVLLHRWRHSTANTGMRHLRSPGVHHLDIEPFSLLRFARQGRRGLASRGQFAPPYNRPALSLFTQHCDELIARLGLDRLHHQGRAVRIDLDDGVAQVTTETGAVLSARNVILAIGASSQPRWPAWAEALRAQGAAVRHVFEPGFVLEPGTLPQRVVVVGAGISGAQVALRLADGKRTVHLVSRHPLREHLFDSDPGWIGPKNMRRFWGTPSSSARREMIQRARHRGSVPPEVHKRLKAAIRDGRVRWRQDTVHRAWGGETLRLLSGMEVIEAEAVLLATGFASRRPGGVMVDGLVERYALPCAECGYPLVDLTLQWHPGLYVTGPLAELALGPVSRNIAGARRAAERILRLPR